MPLNKSLHSSAGCIHLVDTLAGRCVRQLQGCLQPALGLMGLLCPSCCKLLEIMHQWRPLMGCEVSGARKPASLLQTCAATASWCVGILHRCVQLASTVLLTGCPTHQVHTSGRSLRWITHLTIAFAHCNHTTTWAPVDTAPSKLHRQRCEYLLLLPDHVPDAMDVHWWGSAPPKHV